MVEKFNKLPKCAENVTNFAYAFYQFPGWLKNYPYYCPGRGANPRPPAHPDFITSKESHALLVRP